MKTKIFVNGPVEDANNVEKMFQVRRFKDRITASFYRRAGETTRCVTIDASGAVISFI